MPLDTTFQAALADTCGPCASTATCTTGRPLAATAVEDTTHGRSGCMSVASFYAPSPGFIFSRFFDRLFSYIARGLRSMIPSPPSATMYDIISRACRSFSQSQVSTHSTPKHSTKQIRSYASPKWSGASKATNSSADQSSDVAFLRRLTDSTTANLPRPAHSSPSNATPAGSFASHSAGALIRLPSRVQSVFPSHTARMPSNFSCISQPETSWPAKVLASIGFMGIFILRRIYTHRFILSSGSFCEA